MDRNIIKIDVVSDIACPWCYIGKHRLVEAIQQWKGMSVEVDWHPFILNPNIPKEGKNRTTYLLEKFGTTHRPEAMNRIHSAAESIGLTLNFGKEWLAVDTIPLHLLLYMAGQEGFKTKLKERLFYAYFTENLHLNQPEVLNRIMQEFGWDDAKTQAVLNDETILQKVKEEITFYQQRGVSSVPYFIINDQYGLSGAQPPEAFLDAFSQVLQLSLGSNESEHCGIDGDCPA